MDSKLKKRINQTLVWLLTFILMVVICVPGLWVILTGFRPNGEVLSKPAIWIPQDLSLNNFANI
ncbi:MAG: carbohydrate ABC transporter permease, partial [Verrucomicrobia bacterium]|nr:carbohydrate ABC transporter permease [Verrucomicrobiota bacterium]